jgi:predicted small metal-binding protein
VEGGVKAMPYFACKDTGMSCPWWTRENTEAELWERILEHAEKSHGMKKIPSEMLKKIQKAIKK